MIDADPIAVSIARLRLWLSLIVDFNGNNPPPLPNLDYKIMIGDSLVEKLNGKPLVEAHEQGSTTQHGMVFNDERATLQAEFEGLRHDLFGFEGSSDERRRKKERMLTIERELLLKERMLTIERELLLKVLREQRDDLDSRERDLLARTDRAIPARAKRYIKDLDAIHGQRSVIDEIERQVTREQRRLIFPFAGGARGRVGAGDRRTRVCDLRHRAGGRGRNRRADRCGRDGGGRGGRVM